MIPLKFKTQSGEELELSSTDGIRISIFKNYKKVGEFIGREGDCLKNKNMTLAIAKNYVNQIGNYLTVCQLSAKLYNKHAF